MAEIFYHAVPADWTREEKLRYLAKTGSAGAVAWEEVVPNKKHQWLTGDLAPEFDGFLLIGSKAAKQSASSPAVFRTYCRGICSNSDAYVYSFDRATLAARAAAMVESYAGELARWHKKGQPKDVEAFVKVDEHALKWVRRTKKELARGADQGQDLHPLQRFPYARRPSRSRLRLPPRQSQRARMGDRPISNPHRPAQRH